MQAHNPGRRVHKESMGGTSHTQTPGQLGFHRVVGTWSITRLLFRRHRLQAFDTLVGSRRAAGVKGSESGSGCASLLGTDIMTASAIFPRQRCVKRLVKRCVKRY